MKDFFVYKYKGKIFSVSNNIPITTGDIDDFNEILFNYFSNIGKTSEIRVVVLETWMLLEYYIRSALSYSFGMNKFKTDELDPKYQLLPSSFQVCLDKMKLIINTQRKLPLPPTRKQGNTLPYDLWKYIKSKNPQICDEFEQIIEEYNREKYPELYDEKGDERLVIKLYFGAYQNVHIMTMFSNITNLWFDKAIKLNKTRNIAAHVFDSEAIYKELGFAGVNRFEMSRKFCIDLINELCLIRECKSDEKIDIDVDMDR